MTGHQIDKVTIAALPSDNDAATRQTLEAMAQAVRGEIGPDYAGWRDERIRRKALELVAGVQPGFKGEVERLFTFTRDVIPYRRDQVDTQRVQAPLQTIELQSGKCVDKVVLLAALLGSLGYLSRFVVQKVTPGDDWSHVYLEAFDDKAGQWIPLDPTGDGHDGRPMAAPGWKQPVHQEFTFDIFEGTSMLGSVYGNGGIDWGGILSQGIETAGNVAGAHFGGPWYASTNTGTYPLDAFGRPINPQTGALIQQPLNTAPNQAGAAVSPFGTQFNIPWWGWALVGIVAGSYLLGKGRR